MRILFIGPYRQNDGWGNASRHFLKSLCLTKHDVAARPIYLNNQLSYDEISDDEIIVAENSRSDSYDVIIQNSLPNLFRRYGGSKNIGISFFESSIDNTIWPSSIKLMDQMWVSSNMEKSIVDKYCKKVNVVPIPLSGSKEMLDIKTERRRLFNKNKHELKFYFVGENTTRKNIKALITAFHLEFKDYEQVRLILKLNNVGKSPEETYLESSKFINQIKSEMGLHSDPSRYKSEILITEFLSNDDLQGLHEDCDCFVMPSSGEGFCIPAFEAVKNGSWVIANKNTSISDYVVEGENGYLVESERVPAIAPDRPLNFLYNGRDYWYDVKIDSLRDSMRAVYDLSIKNNQSKKFNEENILPKYTYKAVSEKMGEYLND